MNIKGKTLFVLAGLALTVGIALAQKNKPWTQWAIKDAEKILNNSGWGQTQTKLEAADEAPSWSTDSRAGDGIDALNEDTGVHFYIRFLSAKPVRQAFLRLTELNPTKNLQQQVEKMRQFVDSEYEKTIVIAVDYFGKDVRFTAPVYNAFSTANMAALKDDVYLIPKGGKRVNLVTYEPPVPGEGLGCKLTFPRMVDGQPVITAKTGDVRFYAKFPPFGASSYQIILNVRFKVSDFMYEGKLEF
jgi:hypothetical protein